jgi:hypothetical protein
VLLPLLVEQEKLLLLLARAVLLPLLVEQEKLAAFLYAQAARAGY